MVKYIKTLVALVLLVFAAQYVTGQEGDLAGVEMQVTQTVSENSCRAARGC